MSFPSPSAEAPYWCQPWGSRGRVRSAPGPRGCGGGGGWWIAGRLRWGMEGRSVQAGGAHPKPWETGGGRSTEGVHSGCSAGCGWDSGGPGQPVVCGLPAATGTTHSEGWRGWPCCVSMLGCPASHPPDGGAAIVSEAIAPRLLHVGDQTGYPCPSGQPVPGV